MSRLMSYLLKHVRSLITFIFDVNQEGCSLKKQLIFMCEGLCVSWEKPFFFFSENITRSRIQNKIQNLKE